MDPGVLPSMVVFIFSYAYIVLQIHLFGGKESRTSFNASDPT
jgi:hypothetical protein